MRHHTPPLSSSLALPLLLALRIPSTPLKKGGFQVSSSSKGTSSAPLPPLSPSPPLPSPDQGLTLIECLVAIIIITITILAITPPILLATATRVQSRRAEQANQIAQAELDRIRFVVERGGYNLNDLPGSTGNNNQLINAAAATSPPAALLQSPRDCPQFTRYPTTTPLPVNSLVLVDIDGKLDENGRCTAEYMMQVFRNNGPTLPGTPTPPPITFNVGVRVYAYNPNEAFPTLLTTRSSLVAGTTARDRRANNARQPLAALYSTMARNDQNRSLGQICNQIPGATCNF